MSIPMRHALAAFVCALALGGCETLGDWREAAETPTAARTHVEPGEAAAAPVKIQPGQSRQLLLEMVGALQGKNLHRAALAYLDEYEGKHPGDEWAQVLRAKSLSALGMSREAETVYWGLINSRHAPAAYNGLGVVAAREGRWRAAEQEFRRAVELKPTNAGFLNNLGHAQLRLEKFDEAHFTLSQALELKPDDVSTRANMILCVRLTGHGAEAERLMNAVSAGDRGRIGAFVAEYLRQGEPGSAAAKVLASGTEG